MQEIYNFNLQGYYTTMSYARENPMYPGEYLYPARTTPDPPPSVGANQIPRRVSGAWTVDVDYRGSWYDVDTQATIEVWDAGEPQPPNTTNVIPPPNEPTWVFTGTVWERTLTVAKEEKYDEITDAFGVAKEATYSFSGHEYSLKDAFVLLLVGSLDVTDSGGMVSVYDDEHVIITLTKPDAQDLLEGIYTTSIALTLNRETKYREIVDASDIPTVDGISW